MARASGTLDSFGTVARAVPSACDKCHEPGTGQKYVPFWQEKIKTLYEQVEKRVKELEGLAAAEKDQGRDEAFLMCAWRDSGTMRVQRTGRSERWMRLGVMVVALALTTVGCGPQRAGPFGSTGAPLVWPEPPEQPRIMYLGAVSTETDMEKRGSLFEGLGELLFGKKPVGVLVCPYAVAVDPTGIMYVADSGGAVVHVFDLRTRDYRQFSALGKNGKFERPIGLAVLGGRVYVADSGLRQVCVFKKNREFLSAFGQDRFKRPAGIACQSPQGTIYVADAANHAIEVFDRNGVFLREFGSRGTGWGQFNFPTHLCIDRVGQLYVSDTLNYRIQVFGPDDRFVRMFGQQGDRPGNFAHPCGVACDRLGNLYVTDRQFENVQIFDAQGRLLMALSHEGTAPGEFWLPASRCSGPGRSHSRRKEG